MSASRLVFGNSILPEINNDKQSDRLPNHCNIATSVGLLTRRVARQVDSAANDFANGMNAHTSNI